LCARFGNARGGDAQVAIVFQRSGDQLLQARVGKIMLPISKRNSAGAFQICTVRPR